jgi:hypothetical protein
VNPAFSSTRADAGLFAKTSAEIRRSKKIFETEISYRSHRLSHDAASPELLAQPVTHCRCMPMHVLAWVNTNPTDGYAINLNAKFHCQPFAYGSLQEFVRVLDRVRMREKIAYRQSDLAIVRVPCQRFSIIQSPWANDASFDYSLLNLIPVFCTSR